MIVATIAPSLIGPLEIAKWVCVFFFVASTIGVIVGVYWEGEKFGKAKQHRGWLILLAALAAETAFGVLIFAADGWISEIQRREIISLQLQTANRDISVDDLAAMTTKLTAFSGQPAKIVIYPVTFESVWIADKLYGVLLNAHWKVADPERLLAPPGKAFMVQGMWVDRSNDDASKRAAKALRETLNATIAQASGMGDEGVSTTGAFDVSKPLVWIMVGDKPAPLRSWVPR